MRRVLNRAALVAAIGLGACTAQEKKITAVRHGDVHISKLEERAEKQKKVPDPFCEKHPEIEKWAKKRDLDPKLVRALALKESALHQCAAARVCADGYNEIGPDNRGCHDSKISKDEGYDNGYDQMYDPSGRCDFANAPNQKDVNGPYWRWLGLGVMQTLEPPYTFWSAKDHPKGVDGQYFEVYKKSLLNNLDLYPAKECSNEFNPFNVDHSVCLGTKKMETMLEYSKGIVGRFVINGWVKEGSEEEKELKIYIAGHLYSGSWGADTRERNSKCPEGMPNGACWTGNFRENIWTNSDYCAETSSGELPYQCEDVGVLRVDPPEFCHGYTDFRKYVKDCEMPYLIDPVDQGERLLKMYKQVKETCRRGR